MPADPPPDERAVAALEALRRAAAGPAARQHGPGADELVDPGRAGWPPLPPWVAERWPSLGPDAWRWGTLAALALGGLLAVVWLVPALRGAEGAAAPPPSLPFTTTTAPVPATPTTSASLVVHAAGAVVRPGLHTVPAGARVADVVAAAGGLAPDADQDRLNLAAPVADGERLFVPRLGEPDVPPVVGGSAPGGGGAAGAGGEGAAPGPVDLNTATAEALDALPGIGPSTAAAILEHRERVGPFTSVDGLLDVRGIGPAKLEALRDLVVVG